MITKRLTKQLCQPCHIADQSSSRKFKNFSVVLPSLYLVQVESWDDQIFKVPVGHVEVRMMTSPDHFYIDFQLQLDRIQERDSFHIFSLIDIFKDMQIKISE